MKYVICGLFINVNNYIILIFGGEKRKGEKRGWWIVVIGLFYYIKIVDIIYILVYVNSVFWSYVMLWCWCINLRLEYYN